MSKVEEISRGWCSVCGQPATEDWQKYMAPRCAAHPHTATGRMVAGEDEHRAKAAKMFGVAEKAVTVEELSMATAGLGEKKTTWRLRDWGQVVARDGLELARHRHLACGFGAHQHLGRHALVRGGHAHGLGAGRFDFDPALDGAHGRRHIDHTHAGKLLGHVAIDVLVFGGNAHFAHPAVGPQSQVRAVDLHARWPATAAARTRRWPLGVAISSPLGSNL